MSRLTWVMVVIGAVFLMGGCQGADKLPAGDKLVQEGMDLYDQGDYEAAIGKYEQALSEERDKYGNSIVYTYLSSAYQELGDQEKALSLCQKAVEEDPENYKAYTNMGVVCRLMGRDEDALEAYRKAISINPDYAQPYSNIGALLLIKDRPEEAIGYLEDAVIRDSGLASNYANLAVAYAQTGDFEKADEALANAEKYGFEKMDGLRAQVDGYR